MWIYYLKCSVSKQKLQIIQRNRKFNEKVQEEIRIYLETNKNKSTTFQKSIECSKSNAKSQIYGDTSLSQKPRKVFNNLTYHSKKLEKEQTKQKEGNKKYQGGKK